MSSAKGLACTAKLHTPASFTTSHGNYYCDECGKKFPKGSTLWGCRTCNYDVCGPCRAPSSIKQTTAFAAVDYVAGRGGAGTVANVMGRETGYAVQGMSGIARGAQAGASMAVGGASIAGGMVGEFAGGRIAEKCNAAPDTKYYVKNTGGLGGSAAGGAAAGAVVAGPVGAAAGAVIGSVGYGVGKGVMGVYTEFVDKRHKFGGFMVNPNCARCEVPIYNRGCKRCRQKLCMDCYAEHSC